MLVAWRYRKRKSLIQSFDPRAWLIFFVCFIACTLVFLGPALPGGFSWDWPCWSIFTSGIKWHEMARAWLFIGGFILFFSLLTFLTGRGGVELYTSRAFLLSSWRCRLHIFSWTPTLNFTWERTFLRLEHAGARLQPGQHDHSDPVFAQPGPVWDHLPRPGPAG